MKKTLISLLFITFFGIFFIGCQGNDDITSSIEELEKPTPLYTFNCDPAELIDGQVELVAGQNEVVGEATFEFTNDGLVITYTIDDLLAPGALITEVHIDFATTLNNVSNEGGFHANGSGNPKIGHFDINEMIPGIGVNEWSTTVSLVTLRVYLNLNPGADIPVFYIAAHGVVCSDGGTSQFLCPTLPNGKWRYLDWGWGINYYVEGAKLYESNDENSTLLYDNLNGWCVDRDRSVMGVPTNIWQQVDFLCSTEDLSGLCLIDMPENIGAVNWLLNNKDFEYGEHGEPMNNMADIQVAIWRLIDYNGLNPTSLPENEDRVSALVEEALLHNAFEPQCGDIIGVLMFETGVDYCAGSPAIQVVLIERFAECYETECETMWGFDYDNGPLEDYSCRFVDPGNWARYFKFDD